MVPFIDRMFPWPLHLKDHPRLLLRKLCEAVAIALALRLLEVQKRQCTLVALFRRGQNAKTPVYLVLGAR